MTQENPTCCTPQNSVKKNISKPIDYKKIKSNNTSKKKFEGKMIDFNNGDYLMGTDYEKSFVSDGEGPIRKVKFKKFSISETSVTNKDFLKFIKDTNYITDAEKFGWSFCFFDSLSENEKNKVNFWTQGSEWWCRVDGAKWNSPEGPKTNIENKMDHPVVHISWNDANAYCRWSGNRLPSEIEWEYAARGGLEQALYPWGDELLVEGKHMCNIWQGTFPSKNECSDGYFTTAPAKSYEPNNFGLYNVVGNVWEWTSDWFTRYHNNNNSKPPKTGNTKVIKGGSFLCHESYCNRYRVAARSSNTTDSSTANMGFRIAKNF
ncbi:MAG: serine/threonine protein phosphatase [Chloroflexi bacterium]|nr:serine/threonine protein phosphatase [Chloroflexota bacterium]|tara:strand:+ start:68 stop:1024 length:957 start_codon:yes stop_codon:yes gene_type:complete